MVHRAGTDNNDCERNAAKRLVAKLRQDQPPLKVSITEDSLSAQAPPIATRHDHALRYSRGGKAGAHAYWFQKIKVAAPAGRVTSYERHERAAGLGHRLRFLHDMPRNASPAHVRVNVLESWDRGDAQGQPCRWVTALRVSTRNVYALMRGGRARWPIENDTVNTWKNQGSHVEHNYGHGEQNLSVVLATSMRLAVLVDQPQPLGCPLLRAVGAKLGSKRLLWERMRAVVHRDTLASRHELWQALWYGDERQRPLWITDSS
jgi:hypothetical protein